MLSSKISWTIEEHIMLKALTTSNRYLPGARIFWATENLLILLQMALVNTD